MAEAELRQERDARIGIRHRLAHEILARDTEMGLALGDMRDDVGDRQERDLDALDADEAAAIVARRRRPGRV